MSGNVLEWCGDWYYKKAYKRYGRGDLAPPQSGSARVVLGGSWYGVIPDIFLASARLNYYPGRRDVGGGFRCVGAVGVGSSPGVGSS